MATAAVGALRVAAVWGTSLVDVRTLRHGESYELDAAGAGACAIPEGVDMAKVPLGFVRGGWALDPRGALGGTLWVRGREEDPVALARTGAAIAVLPGDYGLIQYGIFSVFFQHTTIAPPPGGRVPFELLVVLALFSSSVLHVSVLGLLRLTMTPDPLAKPLELTSPDELAARFRLHRVAAEPTPTATEAGEKSDAARDRADRDRRSTTGGQRVADARQGREGRADRSDVQPTPNLGGLSDVLNSDTGDEIKRTLSTINSVADALNGLNAQNILVGGGVGAGLRGGAGGMTGVAFGTGTMQTGLGAPGAVGGAIANGVDARRGAADPAREARVLVADQAPAASGGLAGEQISRVVRAHQGALRACFETEAQRNPNLRGGVTLAWQIDKAGNVTGASLANSTLNNPRVEGCMVRQVKGWHFPPSDTPTSVASYPFRFGVGG
jgi:hypothetical protein